MPEYCMVEFCKNSGKIPGVTYFRLTGDRHDVWMRAMGKDPTKYFTRGYRVCSLHFPDKDLVKTPKGLAVRKGALPSINLGDQPKLVPQPLQQKVGTGMSTSNTGKPHTRSSNKNASQKDYEPKMACMITKRTLDKNAEKIKEVQVKNRKLERRLTKANSLLENLGETCDISEITKQLINGPTNITNVDDTSTDSDQAQNSSDNPFEHVKVELGEDTPSSYVSSVERNKDLIVLEDDEEDCSNQINSFKTENQVQTTFLVGSDTAKEGLLKRKLKQLAENDIIKSKKLRELNNIVFIKNKMISELREEIEKRRGHI